MREGTEKKKTSRKERERETCARLHKRHVYKLGTEQRYRTIDKTTVKTRKSRATMKAHGKRVGKFMEHGGFSQSWRFIGLIVTRAKRRRRRGARVRKLLPPPWKYFHPSERRRDGAREQKSRNEKGNAPEEDRDVDAAVKMSKSWQTRVCRREIYGLSLERTRFIEQTERGAVEEKFPLRTKLHARRKHV